MNAEEYTLRCMGDIWSALFGSHKNESVPGETETEPVQLPLPFP